MSSRLYFLAVCFGCLIVAAIISFTRIYSVICHRSESVLNYQGKSLALKQQQRQHPQGGVDSSSGDRCYTISSDWVQHLKPNNELNSLGCKQKLPKVLIIGARTSGTRTLNRLLGFHPQLATAAYEVKFFDKNFNRGLEWYKSQMPFSLPGQLTVESTEGYVYHRNASLRVSKTLGDDVKIIMMLRDPVARSISDYLLTHQRIHDSKMTSSHFKRVFKESRSIDRLLVSGKGKHGRRGSTKMSYTVENTFEKTVLRSPDQVSHKNIFIADSLYVYYLRSWIKKLMANHVLTVNAEIFARKPYEAVAKVEEFLGVKPFFKPDYFRFDMNTSTFCLQKPQSICMPRLHVDYPVISEVTITKLRGHFENSCRYLFLLLKHYVELIGDIPLNYHPIE
ncbi:heparan sulfate glucosamine 3-O-sulfotransferase 1-like [Lytechinus variegatus]|uniref:heparan sulfate glucosamine 3-O-sulfotransferase 1-like n=1 Tax=Lytechinus variegatus TaxID=7654 RepID=UPI001BB120AC|nr:heparan sulfate glucosamine 3-O-sulfotransferase 1-like [Lytechinus variegatus]